MGIALLILAQKTMNGAMQNKGDNKEATRRLANPTDDVAMNTTARKVVTAANPKRQILIHHNKPKMTPKITPIAMKNIHRTQQNRESATVLLNT